MIIMYDTCDSNISGNDTYDDAGLYCHRGLKKRRGIMCISEISLDTLREEILVKKKPYLLSIEKFDFDTFLRVSKLPKLFACGVEV